MGGEDVKSKELTGDVTRAPSNALGVWGVLSYRGLPSKAVGGERRLRVSVELELMDVGIATRAPARAALLSQGGQEKELTLRPVAPPHPAAPRRLRVETELTEGEALDAYTLRLWDAHGGRLVELGGVTFP